jgi:hypothetical protein
MYRYDKDSSEWKERGIGQAKFLKSKSTQKIRFLMRQDKTLKIRSNHISTLQYPVSVFCAAACIQIVLAFHLSQFHLHE